MKQVVDYRFPRGTGRAERLHVVSTHEIGDRSAVAEAAIAGLGIAQMPSSPVAQALADGKLIEVLPKYGTVPVGVYALWPETRHLLAWVRHVVDLLSEKDSEALSDGLNFLKFRPSARATPFAAPVSRAPHAIR
jgi:DNA-binding transcriptional LysR family regulator